MFDLNPFHLENASLLHFLMLQGAAILAYLIFRERFKQQLGRLNEKYQLLQAELDAREIIEPEVEEVFSSAPGRDDLKEIAGVNTKVEAILNGVGIHTFTQLANTPITTIRRVLAEHGPLIYTDDPVTWPKQAWLAAEGRWDELRGWQEQMRKGVYTDFQPTLLL
ncbi:hypothetical protein [Spirosoma linguale]|uniref:DUF4332 domain-containing protein n=1 Tax=Spirosoma linguale (strain ATCC 33905 / DSM 74 / LMG 10896 / Claus 1) TaxID=504472 RepID=D2QJN7_SPILD|nr:hypothetical protein Slin_4096 [Spirosoma linguale DSM 74]